MKPLSDCRLYTFVDTAFLRGRTPEHIAQQLCDGGSDLIQLRAKTSSRAELRKLAQRILPILRSAKVGFVINDDWQVAEEMGADLCHLGQEDFFDAGHSHISNLPASHGRIPPRLGLSTHSPDQATRAMKAGAAYIAIGPVYATGTKPTATPVTLDYVRWAATNATVPWFAIGGINLSNIDQVLQAGAQRICVLSAILAADNIAKACAEFRARLL
jgi:thiamine-phosphate pyrophosphorylase